MQAPALLPHNGEGVAQEPESDAIERPLRAPRAVPRHSEPSRQGRSSIADALTFRQPSHTRQLAKACQPRTGPLAWIRALCASPSEVYPLSETSTRH